MAKEKPRSKPAPPAVPQSAAAAAPRVNPLVQLLEKRSRAVALAFIAIAALRIIATYSDISVTWDEPGHMACGLQYLAEHVYRYESQHPPLARVMSALGPFLSGARPLHGQQQDLEGVAVM